MELRQDPDQGVEIHFVSAGLDLGNVRSGEPEAYREVPARQTSGLANSTQAPAELEGLRGDGGS